MYTCGSQFCRIRAVEHRSDAFSKPSHFRLIPQDVYCRLDEVYHSVSTRLSFR